MKRSRAELHRRSVLLFDQQCWCWGRDIAHPEGNLFLRLGMCQFRPAHGEGTHTAYTGRVADDGVVWLWGFGLLYWLPDYGGLFLRRNRFEPLLVSEPLDGPVHQPERLGPMVRPQTARQKAAAVTLLRHAAGWMANYEHWVAETFGSRYRESTLASWDKPATVAARDTARSWEHVAKKADRLLAIRTVSHGPWASALNSVRLHARMKEAAHRY